jgi:hypothetical protein
MADIYTNLPEPDTRFRTQPIISTLTQRVYFSLCSTPNVTDEDFNVLSLNPSSKLHANSLYELLSNGGKSFPTAEKLKNEFYKVFAGSTPFNLTGLLDVKEPITLEPNDGSTSNTELTLAQQKVTSVNALNTILAKVTLSFFPSSFESFFIGDNRDRYLFDWKIAVINVSIQGEKNIPEWDIHKENPVFDDVNSLLSIKNQRDTAEYIRKVSGEGAKTRVDGFIFRGSLSTVSSTAQTTKEEAGRTVVEFQGKGKRFFKTIY